MFKQIVFTALIAVVVAKPGIHSVAYLASYVAAPAVYSAYSAPFTAAYTAPVAAAYTAPVAAAYTAPVAAAYTAPIAAAYTANVATAYSSPIVAAAYRAPVLFK
ncbi:jg25301 [Pararge aegeria aegeria]|uniref:Jg25301 protein n=1 Tax=Pararge aegeria aegeria TaxID=348720 RepID=A0A8S4RZF2_9NEOP|nr:jg25301 [Pararge aegeria aegeria]